MMSNGGMGIDESALKSGRLIVPGREWVEYVRSCIYGTLAGMLIFAALPGEVRVRRLSFPGAFAG